MKLGYACINMTLGALKPRIATNRRMQKKTLEEKGLEYVSQLALQNAKDLIEIIKWNENNNIKFYRMSSDMFSWQSEYSFDDIPKIEEISSVLKMAGNLAISLGHRITFHPGPFIVLSSPDKEIIRKSLYEIEQHSRIMDMMGLPNTSYSKINIHLGGVYGDKSGAIKRWSESYHRLSENARSRLTIENDSSENLYNILDLIKVHNNTGVPIVFDYHHHLLNNNKIDEKSALFLAISTWPNDIIPVVHYSESKRINEKLDIKISAHSDYINDFPNLYDNNLDIMFECKKKELAILNLINKKIKL